MSELLLKRILEKHYPRWSPSMYKITLGSFVVLAFVIPLVLVALPFIEFLNGMAAQPKAKPQMTYGRIFGERIQVERMPPAGVQPQDYIPAEFAGGETTMEDANRIGSPLVNPVERTRANIEKGRERYEVFCITCHGPRGEGNGSVTGPNRYPAPPSLHTENARGYTDGTIYYIITKGIGKMPGYAVQIEPEERWQSVFYVRALQRAMNPKPEDLDE